MNSIAAHVEYLLRKHDCVVLPGLGALLCNYVPAHFDESNPLSINPPGRALAFNSMLVDSDGMLAWSVARREGISFEAASKKVADEITMLRRQLLAEGEIVFGRLGVFVTEGTGEVMFYPASLPSVNGAFYGLQPIEAVPLDMTDSSHGQAAYARQVGEAVVAESVATRRAGWRAYATGIVASLAIGTQTEAGTEQAIKIFYRFGGYIGERRFKAKALRNTGGWEIRRRKEGKDDEKVSFVF